MGGFEHPGSGDPLINAIRNAREKSQRNRAKLRREVREKDKDGSALSGREERTKKKMEREDIRREKQMAKLRGMSLDEYRAYKEGNLARIAAEEAAEELAAKEALLAEERRAKRSAEKRESNLAERSSTTHSTMSNLDIFKRLEKTTNVESVDVSFDGAKVVYTLKNKEGRTSEAVVYEGEMDGNHVYVLEVNKGVTPSDDFNATRSARETTQTFFLADDVIRSLERELNAGYIHFGELPDGPGYSDISQVDPEYARPLHRSTETVSLDNSDLRAPQIGEVPKGYVSSVGANLSMKAREKKDSEAAPSMTVTLGESSEVIVKQNVYAIHSPLGDGPVYQRWYPGQSEPIWAILYEGDSEPTRYPTQADLVAGFKAKNKLRKARVYLTYIESESAE